MKIPALNECFKPELKTGKLYEISSKSESYYSFHEMSGRLIKNHVCVNNGEIGLLLDIKYYDEDEKIQFDFLIKNRILSYSAYYGRKDFDPCQFDARFEEIYEKNSCT